MLLDHTSGLPSYVPFYRTAGNREDSGPRRGAFRLEGAPGERAKYSRGGFTAGRRVGTLSGW